MSEFVHLFRAAQPGHPVFVCLHGMGGSKEDLLPLVDELDPQAGFLALEGQVLENGVTRRFFKRLGAGRFDQDDLAQRTADLNSFLVTASQHYHFDVSNVILLGYSNGANFAASLLFRYPFRGKGAILLHAMVPTRGLSRPDLSQMPIFMSAGTNDPISPPSESRELALLLQEQQATLSLHWSAKGHSLTTESIHSAKAWSQTL